MLEFDDDIEFDGAIRSQIVCIFLNTFNSLFLDLLAFIHSFILYKLLDYSIF